MDEKKFILCVDETELIKEYDFGHFKFIDTTAGIIFHVKGGYDLLVKPRMAALYQHLRELLDMQSQYSEYDEEKKRIYDATFNATVANLEIPLFMASNDVHLFKIAQTAIEFLNEATDDAMNKVLEPETPIENGEFERREDAKAAMKEAEEEAQKA